MSKVLVLAVHPDDETLGCGGTLLRHKANGDDVFWLIATCMKEEDGFSRDDIVSRQKQIQNVANMYEFSRACNLEIPTTRVDEYSMNELIKRISKVIQDIKPNIIYLPFREDVHSDHRRIFTAAYSCIKSFRCCFIEKTLMMETISETEFAPAMNGCLFIPNYFVDISSFFEQKLAIMKVYESEVTEHPFPRSLDNIEAIAHFRGAMAGCKYAESFMILKEIWKS